MPHYARNKAVGVMKPGHCFTIEPMINAGTWQDKLWPDNWTAVTADGKRSAQFEHTMIVTKNGVDVLTAPVPDADLVRSPPAEAKDKSGATRVKCPPHLAKFAEEVGVTVEIDERYNNLKTEEDNVEADE